MPNISDLMAAQGGGQVPDQGQDAPQIQVPQKSAGPAGGGGNPLAAMMAQAQAGPQQQPPAPTHAQTVAALHRFTSIRSELMPIIDDPNLGKKNIRPKLLDAASKLLAKKVLPLTEIMAKIKGLPSDPLQQKKFVDNFIGILEQAQNNVLEHHKNAPPEQPGQEQEQWSPETHDNHIQGLMQHYGVKNG